MFSLVTAWVCPTILGNLEGTWEDIAAHLQKETGVSCVTYEHNLKQFNLITGNLENIEDAHKILQTINSSSGKNNSVQQDDDESDDISISFLKDLGLVSKQPDLETVDKVAEEQITSGLLDKSSQLVQVVDKPNKNGVIEVKLVKSVPRKSKQPKSNVINLEIKNNSVRISGKNRKQHTLAPDAGDTVNIITESCENTIESEDQIIAEQVDKNENVEKTENGNCQPSDTEIEHPPRKVKKKMRFDCELCDYHTGNKRNLRAHVHRNHLERNCVCSRCGKAFGLRKDLLVHMRVHSSQRYECNICHKQYKVKSIYDRHMRSHKSDFVPEFVCDQCGKVFNIRATLKMHKDRVHSGVDTKYKCETCGHCFSQKQHLLEHENKHKGLKPCVCSICGKCFTYSSSLRHHMLIHDISKRYTCEVCGKSFAQRGAYASHKVIHSGERAHLCKYCGKGFTQRHSVIRHERIHTGEKPFKCDICHKSFRDESTIRRHRAVHKEKEVVDFEALLDNEHDRPPFHPKSEVSETMKQASKYEPMTKSQLTVSDFGMSMGFPEQDQQYPDVPFIGPLNYMHVPDFSLLVDKDNL